MLNSPLVSQDLGEWAFDVGQRKSSLVIYRMVRRSVRVGLFPYLRTVSSGTDSLNLPGPLILAPAHRSHLDSIVVASLSDRRIRALAKESLFTTPGLGWACAAMGAIPVRRGQADLAAMKSAKRLLDQGEAMIVFPEGSRQSGRQIGELFDGVAWLAARTGAKVIPIGVTGTDGAMGEGAKMIRRSNVGIVVGEPLAAPVGSGGRRANREQMGQFTRELGLVLQQAQDDAIALARTS